MWKDSPQSLCTKEIVFFVHHNLMRCFENVCFGTYHIHIAQVLNGCRRTQLLSGFIIYVWKKVRFRSEIFLIYTPCRGRPLPVSAFKYRVSGVYVLFCGKIISLNFLWPHWLGKKQEPPEYWWLTCRRIMLSSRIQKKGISSLSPFMFQNYLPPITVLLILKWS